MPVTFQVSALITAAEAAVRGGNIAAANYQKATAEYRQRKAGENDVIPNIRALRDELSAFLKTRRIPTYGDAQRFKKAARMDYLSRLYTTEPSDNEVRNNVERPKGWLLPSTLDSYRGLITMLKAHTEETITANQLKLCGYDKLEPLFRQAALSGQVTSR